MLSLEVRVNGKVLISPFCHTLVKWEGLGVGFRQRFQLSPNGFDSTLLLFRSFAGFGFTSSDNQSVINLKDYNYRLWFLLKYKTANSYIRWVLEEV